MTLSFSNFGGNEAALLKLERAGTQEPKQKLQMVKCKREKSQNGSIIQYASEQKLQYDYVSLDDNLQSTIG